MRLGLIVRADDSGLGVQTRLLYKYLKPAKTLVIDSTRFNDRPQHLDWYPDAWRVNQGFISDAVAQEFLDDLDVVFTVEIPYNYNLFKFARERKIATILQYNFEFLDYLQQPDLPLPTMLAAPSRWRMDEVPYPNKIFLPPPVDREALSYRKIDEAKTFVHIVGRPATHDRNGTIDLLRAVQHIKSNVKIVLKCQEPGWLDKAILEHSQGTPANVELVADDRPIDDYTQILAEADVLVLPRRFGGLCLPLAEALSQGIPAIMPDCSPNNLWLPKDWLVPASVKETFMARTNISVYQVDPLALAQKIDKFAKFTKRQMYEQNLQAGALAHNLSWDVLGKEYNALMEVVCKTVRQ